MIRVKPRWQPAGFDALVREPGRAWLEEHPLAQTSELPPLWRKALDELRDEYKGICAYFCCYVRPATGGRSVDHFVPKSGARELAYDWDNYRFACARMNSRKNNANDVLDPFQLVDGDFELWFPTMQVRPSGRLSRAHLGEVKQTILRLGLNSVECSKERQELWDDYDVHGLSCQRLIEVAPFIAMEAARQELLSANDHGVHSVMTIRAWLDG